MSDSAPAPALRFEPVSSASKRHDGWTPERQRIFIDALRQLGMVSAAAKAAGMSRKSAYALLKRAGPESSFARAWSDAQISGETNTYYTLLGRAIHGVEQPYFYRGVQCGTRRVYDNRLLIAAFRAAERKKAQKKALKKARKRELGR